MIQSTFCSSTNANTSEETPNNSQKTDYKYCTNESIKSGESKFKVFSFEPATKDDYYTQKCIDFWKLIESRTDLKPAKGYNMKKCPPAIPETKVAQEVTVKEALDFVRQKGLVKLAMQSRKQCKMCVFENTRVNYGDDFVVDDRCISMQELDDFQKKTYENAEAQTNPIYTRDVSAQVSYIPHPSLEKKNLLLKQLESFGHLAGQEKSQVNSKDNLCICESKVCQCSVATDKLSQISSSTNARKIDKCTCSCDLAECLCSQLFEIVRSSDAANAELARLSKWEIEKCPCSETACACLNDYELIMQTQMDIEELLKEKLASGSREKCVCSCGQEKCPCQILIDLHDKIGEIITGYEEHFLDGTPPYAVDECECENYCTCLDYYKQVIEDNIRRKKENLSSSLISSTYPDRTLKEPLDDIDECNDCICTLEKISSQALCKQFPVTSQETKNQSINIPSSKKSHEITSNTTVKSMNLRTSTSYSDFSRSEKRKSSAASNATEGLASTASTKKSHEITSNTAVKSLIVRTPTSYSDSSTSTKQKSSVGSNAMQMQEKTSIASSKKFNEITSNTSVMSLDLGPSTTFNASSKISKFKSSAGSKIKKQCEILDCEPNLTSSPQDVKESFETSKKLQDTHSASIVHGAISNKISTPTDKKKDSISVSFATNGTSVVEETKLNESPCSNNQGSRQSKVESQRQIIDNFLREFAPCKQCFENEISFTPVPKESKKSKESPLNSNINKLESKVSENYGSSRVKDELKETETRNSEYVSFSREKLSKTQSSSRKSCDEVKAERKQTGSFQDNKTAETSSKQLGRTSDKSRKTSSGYMDLERKRSQYSAQKDLKPEGDVIKYCSKVLQPNECEVVDGKSTCGLRGDCGCNKNANRDEKVAEIYRKGVSEVKHRRSTQYSKSDLEIKGNKTSDGEIMEKYSNATCGLKGECIKANEDKRVAEIYCNKVLKSEQIVVGQNVCGLKGDSTSIEQSSQNCRTVIISKENNSKLIRCEPNVVVKYTNIDASNGDCNCSRNSMEQNNLVEILSEPGKNRSIDEFKPTCQPEEGVFTCRTIYNPTKKFQESSNKLRASKTSGRERKDSIPLIRASFYMWAKAGGSDASGDKNSASKDVLKNNNSLIEAGKQVSRDSVGKKQ